MTSAHAGSGELSSAGQAVKASVVKNRVMSWNSNGQGYGTPQLVAEQIKRFKPQIVLLQESCSGEVDEAVKLLKQQGLEYDTYHAGWSNIHPSCDGVKTLGSAVLAAKGTQVEGFNTARYDARDWGENRHYSSFVTRLAGRDVRVFNTQLSDGADADLRSEQFSELLEATRGMRNTLIGGDLNAQPWYWEMEPIWVSKFSDVDPFCKKAWDRRCNGTHVNSGKKFDYILHKGQVNSRRCMLHTVNLDHRVVVSDLTAGQASRRSCSVV